MDLAIGDESTPGYTSKSLNARTVSRDLSRALGEKTISKGMKGANLTLGNKSSLLHQLVQFSLPAYDRIFLFYGANDYFHSKKNLGDIGQTVSQAIQTIRKQNQWIKIYGILPLPMYDEKGQSYASQRGPAYYTLHDLCMMLSVTYSNNRARSLNWLTLTNPIINRNNYKQRLVHGRYPTERTYQLIANRIARFVKQDNGKNRV